MVLQKCQILPIPDRATNIGWRRTLKKHSFALVLALLLASILASAFTAQLVESDRIWIESISASTFDSVAVHFFDVGQGDSILIQAGDKNVLIDGGPKAAGSILLSYLHDVNVTYIDFIIATHPHADHIGGLIAVMQSTISINTILHNGQNLTTQTFQEFMALAQDYTLILAERNEIYVLTATTNFTVFNPVQPLEYSDVNANSIVVKLEVGNASFLFTGDATADTEQSMIDAGLNLQSNMLKIGHHGSKTSTTVDFLNTVNPTYAVISAGLDNKYGHPHEETVQKLHAKGVITYGTYKSGTITFTTNGNTIMVHDNPEPIYPVLTYALTISTTLGGTTNPPIGTHNYPATSTVQVTAIPDIGFSFEHWLLDGEAQTKNPIIILTDANYMLEAVFVDDIPPAIGTPTQNPPRDAVHPHQQVKVSVNVTDAGSGIQNVTLHYTNDTSWHSIPMTFNATSALWEAIIPGHAEATQTKYKIIAYDNAGNVTAEDHAGQYYIYTVIPEFPQALILPLLTMLSVFAIAFAKRKNLRKKKC